MDWKIIVTIAAVLVIIAFFASSSPGVSRFLGEIGEKIGSAMDSVGLVLEDTGDHEFSLVLTKSGQVQFRSQQSAIQITGKPEFKMENGFIRPDSAEMQGFSGFGYVNGNITLNGTAGKLLFGESELSNVRIEMTSQPEYFSITNVTVQQISLDSAQGELVLNSSITAFEGQVKVRSFKGSLMSENGTLKIEGLADYILIPGAGVKLE